MARAVAAAWAVAVTCLPRLYFGHHYLPDSAVGALLGAPCATAAVRTPLPADLAVSADTWLRRLSARAPAALLVGFFALGAGCLYMFDSTRKVVAATSQFARAVAPRTRAAKQERARRRPCWRMATTARRARRAGRGSCALSAN